MPHVPENPFCDSCVFRTEAIQTPAGARTCPRRAMDEYGAVALIWAGLDPAPERTGAEDVPPATTLYIGVAADLYLAALDCAANVQQGNAPDLRF